VGSATNRSGGPWGNGGTWKGVSADKIVNKGAGEPRAGIGSSKTESICNLIKGWAMGSLGLLTPNVMIARFIIIIWYHKAVTHYCICIDQLDVKCFAIVGMVNIELLPFC
jgi:hypothetical protein